LTIFSTLIRVYQRFKKMIIILTRGQFEKTKPIRIRRSSLVKRISYRAKGIADGGEPSKAKEIKNQNEKRKTTTQKSKIQRIAPLGRNQWKSLARREGNLKKQSQFSGGQMNVSLCYKEYYENSGYRALGEDKPKQSESPAFGRKS
jgi:hypothetical protein